MAHDRQLMQTRLSIEENETEERKRRAHSLARRSRRREGNDEGRDSLSIHQMPLDRISDPQPLSNLIPLRILQEPLHSLCSTLLNEVRSRPLIASVSNRLLKSFEVMIRDFLGVGELDGDSGGDGELQTKQREGCRVSSRRSGKEGGKGEREGRTNLVDSKVRIWRDDRSTREIDSLS